VDPPFLHSVVPKNKCLKENQRGEGGWGKDGKVTKKKVWTTALNGVPHGGSLVSRGKGPNGRIGGKFKKKN